MLATGPLRVIQQVGVILQGIPCITPCRQKAALTHHEPRALVPSSHQLKPQQNLCSTWEQLGLQVFSRNGKRCSWGLGGVQEWVGGKDVLMRMDPLPSAPEPSVDKTSLHCLAGSAPPRVPSILKGCAQPHTPSPPLSRLRAVGSNVTHCSAAPQVTGLAGMAVCPATVRLVRVPSSVLIGVDLAAAGLYLDAGTARGMLVRGWGGQWLSVFCVTRALVGYRNLA